MLGRSPLCDARHRESFAFLVPDLGNVKLVQERSNTVFALPVVKSGELQYQPEVFGYGKLAEDGGLLGQIPNARAGPAVHGHSCNVLPIEQDAARNRLHQTHYHVKSSGLSRAIWPQEPHYFALLHLNRNTVNNAAAAVC